MERVKYIDTAKGLLIMMVVFLHVGWQFRIVLQGDNPVFTAFHEFSRYTFEMYFMAAFFVIHGFFHKHRTFKDNFINGAKRLLIPMLAIYLNNQWFCWSMFLAVIIYDLLKKVLDGYKLLLVSLILALLIVLLKTKFGFNFLYLHFAFVFVPLLWIGERFRHMIEKNIVGVMGFVICCVVSLVYFHFQHYPPQISGSFYYVTCWDLPLFFLVSVCGTSAVILFSKLIVNNRLVNFVGKNSLVVFLFHFQLFRIINPFKGFIERCGDNYMLSILLFFLFFFIILLCSCAVAKIVNRYFPYVVGKW